MPSRKDRAKALNNLPTYLGLAYDQLNLGSRLAAGMKSHPLKVFQDRLESNEEESREYEHSIFLMKFHVMEHLESQLRRCRENIEMYTKSTADFKRLEEGVGTKDELDAFKLLFNHNSIAR